MSTILSFVYTCKKDVYMPCTWGVEIYMPCIECAEMYMPCIGIMVVVICRTYDMNKRIYHAYDIQLICINHACSIYIQVLYTLHIACKLYTLCTWYMKTCHAHGMCMVLNYKLFSLVYWGKIRR